MAAPNRLVFVLEDEAEIARLISRALDGHGFQTECFARAADFLRRLRTRLPSLSLVDLTLPDDDGLQVVRELRAHHDVPVVIVTGRGDVVDRVLGLELGADDYVVKPFDPRELVARVNAVLRRAAGGAGTRRDRPADCARFGNWLCDFQSLRLNGADGAVVELSAAEARLLLAMVRQPNRVLSRDILLGTAGGDDRSPFDRSIDVRISRLRQKLERDPKAPQIIKTVYGAGYMFAARVEWVARSD